MLFKIRTFATALPLTAAALSSCGPLNSAPTPLLKKEDPAWTNVRRICPKVDRAGLYRDLTQTDTKAASWRGGTHFQMVKKSDDEQFVLAQRGPEQFWIATSQVCHANQKRSICHTAQQTIHQEPEPDAPTMMTVREFTTFELMTTELGWVQGQFWQGKTSKVGWVPSTKVCYEQTGDDHPDFRVGAIPPEAQVFQAKGSSYYPHTSQLEGGYFDRKGQRLRTLQDYLAGQAKYVSVAMDLGLFPYGTKLRIPELERKYGRIIEFRVVDTGGAFYGQGTGRIDICARSYRDTLDRTLNGRLTLVFPKD